jgi:hypothetical protein
MVQWCNGLLKKPKNKTHVFLEHASNCQHTKNKKQLQPIEQEKKLTKMASSSTTLPPLMGQQQEHPMPIQEPGTCTPHQQQASSSGFIAMDVNESTKQARAMEEAILQGKFNYCVILLY